ncbi:ROK family protein [Streptomyces sp. HNM0663]|uniref:ROK family protein n=1 Tax=Streptomyces chengmaiensis TaxID=3040919 RepID=A0ABT6HZ77_9ACTN|nr:ROK family protein [Streptomyces chengmaiensis]MDH2393975.1 ROK family protein [Streptomyces chengmaiensis]
MIVKKLGARQLITSDAAVGSGRGRRPKPIYGNRHRYIVGLEIAPTRITGAIMNLRGNLVLRKHHELPPPEKHQPVDVDVVIDGIYDLITHFKSELPSEGNTTRSTTTNPLLGIGVAVSGHVDWHLGEVRYSPDLHWGMPWQPRSSTLRELIKAATRIKRVVVDNDANARAAGHRWFGAARQLSDDPFAVVVVTPNGVGGAQFIDGALVRGATGMATEVGHLTIERKGRWCRCGNRGCVEALATQGAIVESAKAKNLEEARRLAAEGDAVAGKAFADAGDALGVGVANLINLSDPATVILAGPAVTRSRRESGSLVVFSDDYHEAMRQAIKKNTFGQCGDLDRLLRIAEDEEHEEWNGAQGAATLVIHDIIAGLVDVSDLVQS